MNSLDVVFCCELGSLRRRLPWIHGIACHTALLACVCDAAGVFEPKTIHHLRCCVSVWANAELTCVFVGTDDQEQRLPPQIFPLTQAKLAASNWPSQPSAALPETVGWYFRRTNVEHEQHMRTELSSRTLYEAVSLAFAESRNAYFPRKPKLHWL